jgi:hypothetical protein
VRREAIGMSARVVCSCGWVKRYDSPAAAEFNARRHVCRKDDGVRRATRRYRCKRCGLEAVYEDAGAAEARYWFNKHSCRKREEALLRAALAEQREAMIDRTPQPCHHKQAQHQHGTNACYVLDKCRCLPCSEARSKVDDERRRLKAYGRYHKYVDAYPVRLHVRELMSAGMGLKQIVKVSGVSQGGLWKLMYGKRKPDGSQRPSLRVLRETAEKLYALDPAWTEQPLPLADGALLDHEASMRAARRLQSLVALGWSMSELGRRLGITYVTNAMPVIKGERRLTVGTGRKADALFEQMSMALPPERNKQERQIAARSRNFARAHGWVTPLMLDDLDVDGVELEDLDEAIGL